MSDDNKCPDCLGKGRYVGLNKIEDPCERCKGSGKRSRMRFKVHLEVDEDEMIESVRRTLLGNIGTLR